MNYHCPRPPKQRAFDTSLLMWRRRFLSGTAFSPASLFASGEDGGWYDPSDLTSMFQGINGSGGNPSVGDPVGVVLDKSQMGGQTAASFIAGQAELITNGTFDTDTTGWVLNADGGTIASVGGQLEVTSNTINYRSGTQSFTTVVGRYYLVTGDVVSISGSLGQIIKSDVQATVNNNRVDIGPSGVGSKSGIFRATATTTWIHGLAGLGGGESARFDNISIKEIPGNHLVAPADIQRPLLQTEGGRYYLDFDGADDLLETPTYTGQANPSSLFTAFNPGTGTNFILHRSGDNTGYIFIADDFSGTTGVFSLCGTPTTRLNGEDFSPSTRGVAHAATTNATNVIGFESLDLTNAVFSKIGVSNYAGIWLLEGKWYGTVLIDRALTTEERDNLEIYLANKSGVTL